MEVLLVVVRVVAAKAPPLAPRRLTAQLNAWPLYTALAS